MLILIIRTDKPEAEIGLYKDSKKLTHKVWPAHRQLAETLLSEINQLLAMQNQSLQKTETKGIVCYKGPGSFTGLRIGLTVANTLAYSWDIPIVGTTGQDWIEQGIASLYKGENEVTALPEYGSPVNITKPKK